MHGGSKTCEDLEKLMRYNENVMWEATEEHEDYELLEAAMRAWERTFQKYKQLCLNRGG